MLKVRNWEPNRIFEQRRITSLTTKMDNKKPRSMTLIDCVTLLTYHRRRYTVHSNFYIMVFEIVIRLVELYMGQDIFQFFQWKSITSARKNDRNFINVLTTRKSKICRHIPFSNNLWQIFGLFQPERMRVKVETHIRCCVSLSNGGLFSPTILLGHFFVREVYEQTL